MIYKDDCTLPAGYASRPSERWQGDTSYLLKMTDPLMAS